MRLIAFHPEARDELLVAAERYEEQASGLGVQFIDEVVRVGFDLVGKVLKARVGQDLLPERRGRLHRSISGGLGGRTKGWYWLRRFYHLLQRLR